MKKIVIFLLIIIFVGCQKNETENIVHLQFIDLPMMLYKDKNGTLPDNITDKQGKPLLSWRVELLKLGTKEEIDLYKQFKLDELWNSPHNLKVAQTVPFYYVDPKGPKCESIPPNDSNTILTRMDPQKLNYTPYLGVTGPNAAFRPGKPRHIAKIDQHAAVVVVENSDVLWTEPRDISLEKAKKGDALRWQLNRTQYLEASGGTMDWEKGIAPGHANGPPKFEYESDE
ncbi:MAG: hypothetical protein ABSG67_18680 [Thermoguttaceae bacterium]|jgi:hypothetical protein